MLDFQQKRKVRGVMYHKAMLIALSLLVIMVLHSTWVVYQKKRLSEQMRNVSLEHVDELRAREGDITSKIERLGTDRGVEEEIRSKFNVAKVNESMVIVVENEDSRVATTSLKLGFWQNIWHFFYK